MKILFVDDEPGIRVSLPAILRMHGFEVDSAASVSDALQKISTEQFDVLISDLNIGSPGDGFTVVSAMRRTQPNCVTLILTGYPAFETALQAIRSQVDDYLIKPTGADKLVAAIEERLRSRQPRNQIRLKRVPEILRDHVDEITEAIMRHERDILQLPLIHLTDQECEGSVRSLLLAIARQLESKCENLLPALVEISREHGQARASQGYSTPLVVEEYRVVFDAILDCVHENLLAADVSYLLPDLRSLSDALAGMLRESIAVVHDLRKTA